MMSVFLYKPWRLAYEIQSHLLQIIRILEQERMERDNGQLNIAPHNLFPFIAPAGFKAYQTRGQSCDPYKTDLRKLQACIAIFMKLISVIRSFYFCVPLCFCPNLLKLMLKD
jgi:hypothetical protein